MREQGCGIATLDPRGFGRKVDRFHPEQNRRAVMSRLLDHHAPVFHTRAGTGLTSPETSEVTRTSTRSNLFPDGPIKIE